MDIIHITNKITKILTKKNNNNNLNDSNLPNFISIDFSILKVYF